MKFVVSGFTIFMLIFIAFMVFITFMGDTYETYISLSQVENDDVPTQNFETLIECDSLAVAGTSKKVQTDVVLLQHF